MQISRFGLGARLASGFAVIIFMLLLMTVFAGWQQGNIEGQYAAQEQQGARVNVASQWMASIRLNLDRALTVARLQDAPELNDRIQQNMRDTTALISEFQEQLLASGSAAELEVLEQVGRLRQRYIDIRSGVIAEVQQTGDLTPVEQRMAPAADAYMSQVEELVAMMEAEGARRNQEVEATFATTRQLLVVLAILAVLLGALLAWRLTLSITRPMNEAVRLAEVVADGDLSETIDSDRQDEIGDLLRALGTMQASLATMIGRIQQTTGAVASASNQIASGNLDLSSRTEEAAANLEETASSMEELTATVQHSAESARQATGLARNAAGTAREGGTVMNQVIVNMDEIMSSSREITDITGVIDGIAFQTNILALNAAVEAARAGEQGKGFAVVAVEVRELAQRSAQAAREIKSLIETSLGKIEAGSELVQSAGATMQEIVSAVENVTTTIEEIGAATTEQSNGIGQVNLAVTQLDQTTQQNAALVEESSAAAESLREQAEILNEAVARFRLAESSLGGQQAQHRRTRAPVQALLPARAG